MHFKQALESFAWGYGLGSKFTDEKDASYYMNVRNSNEL